MTESLLELKNLYTHFPSQRGSVYAVKGVNLRVRPGEILGVVGESGCGKSTVLLSILRLIASPGRIEAGDVMFKGNNLLSLSNNQIRNIRGKEISMIFQDPLSSLNPVFSIGNQIREAMQIHGLIKPAPGKSRWSLSNSVSKIEYKRVLEVMEEVGIPAPKERYRSYPHEFSGGMQQRALIAIALVCKPSLILADEPTTALDVTIQAQIMDLLKRINQEHNTSIILVTHNLGLAAEFCHNIAVMYAGQIVERGPAEEVVENPKFPYTKGLLACLPSFNSKQQVIKPIPGSVPDLASLPMGCAYKPRCPVAVDECGERNFYLHSVGPDHYVRCILYEGGERYSKSQKIDANSIK